MADHNDSTTLKKHHKPSTSIDKNQCSLKSTPSPAVPAIIVEIDPDGDIPSQLSDSVVAYKKLPWWDFYKGTAAALISAGIIEEHMLPGQPNRPKTSVRIRGPIGKKRGLGHLYVIKSGTRRYRVYKGISKQEEERRVEEAERMVEEANRRYAESQCQAASSQKSEEKPLNQAELAQQFKTKAGHMLVLLLSMARAELVNADGYGYDDDTLCEFEQKAEELEAIFRSGGIAHSLDEKDLARDSAVAACKADGALQSFLKCVTGDSSLVADEKRGEA